MNFTEFAGKQLLAKAGLATLRGHLCTTPEEAMAAARELGPVVVKAQVPQGKRGKAGGIQRANTPDEAGAISRQMLAMEIGGFAVSAVLIEERAATIKEYYAAVVSDVASRGPLVLFSTEGGVDIEEVAAAHPTSVCRQKVDIQSGFGAAEARALIGGLDLGHAQLGVVDFLTGLYRLWFRHDAEVVEINPLALLSDGRLVALDCKLVLDDAAAYRQATVAALGSSERLTAIEARGRALGLRYIELDGNIGVLANGAGLTMATMDMIEHAGGRPANFLEIGGEAYIQAKPALETVLSNPKVCSLVVNFCGAFARTDVMAAGVADAWEALRPRIPVYFSIHGTGADEAVRLVRERLGIEPYERMQDAIAAAVEAVR